MPEETYRFLLSARTIRKVFSKYSSPVFGSRTVSFAVFNRRMNITLFPAMANVN